MDFFSILLKVTSQWLSMYPMFYLQSVQHIDCGNLGCHLWLRMFNQRWGFKGDKLFFFDGILFPDPLCLLQIVTVKRGGVRRILYITPTPTLGFKWCESKGADPPPGNKALLRVGLLIIMVPQEALNRLSSSRGRGNWPELGGGGPLRFPWSNYVACCCHFLLIEVMLIPCSRTFWGFSWKACFTGGGGGGGGELLGLCVADAFFTIKYM